MADREAWDQSEERGSLLGLRILVWFYRVFGRRVAFLLVDPVVGYFFLTDPRGRSASRSYLERIAATAEGRKSLGRSPGIRACYLHYRSFAVSIFDRLEIWFGRSEDFEVELSGGEHLAQQVQSGRGAVLIGAHLGSFDALRLLAGRHGIPVNIVMYTQHATRINRIFQELSPETTVRVIEMKRGSVNSTLEIRRCIDRGEFVSLLGDRTPLGGGDRSRSLPFLGNLARFPEGPFQLAGLLGCPTLLVLALRSGRRRYQMVAEPLAAAPGGSRRERSQNIEEWMRRYTTRLEHFCLRAPYQWFNFFDFWEESPEDRPR